MNDWVYIRGLAIETRIGAFAWEREIRQFLSFDLDMQTDIRPAAHSDALADALDYKKVSKRVIALVESAEHELIETVMEEVARTVIHEFHVPCLRLRVDKIGALRGARGVGLRIERSREDYP
ncbi:MAG: dihydroneopterin aldolase [Oceanococcaceae bacterium]